jgi:hypothetical protein
MIQIYILIHLGSDKSDRLLNRVFPQQSMQIICSTEIEEIEPSCVGILMTELRF